MEIPFPVILGIVLFPIVIITLFIILNDDSSHTPDKPEEPTCNEKDCPFAFPEQSDLECYEKNLYGDTGRTNVEVEINWSQYGRRLGRSMQCDIPDDDERNKCRPCKEKKYQGTCDNTKCPTELDDTRAQCYMENYSYANNGTGIAADIGGAKSFWVETGRSRGDNPFCKGEPESIYWYNPCQWCNINP